MIEVHNLTKYYGTRPAIQGLNFRAEKGEIVGFLGPNGAGKTTTMRILATYLAPSQGTGARCRGSGNGWMRCWNGCNSWTVPRVSSAPCPRACASG